MSDESPEQLLALYRKHLSTGRASLGEMFGGRLEQCSHGAVVRTHDGAEYLNCAGYGVFLLGATHPLVVEAVVAQVRRHPLSSRILVEPTAALAAKALAEVCPPGLSKVHFTGSGTEAVEAAIKLARMHGKKRLITTVDGYHGKTLGALSVTARAVYQDPFRPLLPDVVEVPYGDADALRAVLADGAPSCFIVEPVQGEGGVIIPPPGYLTEVARLCADHQCLLVVDEIQTGLGRLGRWWGVDAEGVRPDVMLVGKGLSGGVAPVAAAVATPAVFQPFDKDPFIHTSTFAAAPIQMAAVRAAIEALHAESAVAKAAELGAAIKARLTWAVQAHCPHLVADVRGEGLLIGIELAQEGLTGELMLELLDNWVLVNHSMNNSSVLRFTPPAVLTESQLAVLFQACERSLAALGRRFPP